MTTTTKMPPPPAPASSSTSNKVVFSRCYSLQQQQQPPPQLRRHQRPLVKQKTSVVVADRSGQEKNPNDSFLYGGVSSLFPPPSCLFGDAASRWARFARGPSHSNSLLGIASQKTVDSVTLALAAHP